jgi:hypothetical protein
LGGIAPTQELARRHKADHFSDACAQIFPNGDFSESEDCLYLNVWTPAEASGAVCQSWSEFTVAACALVLRVKLFMTVKNSLKRELWLLH